MKLTKQQLLVLLRESIKETISEDDDSPFPSTKKTYGNRSFADLDARSMPRGYQKDEIVSLGWAAVDKLAKSEGERRKLLNAKGWVAALDKDKDDHLVINWNRVDPAVADVFKNLRSVPVSALIKVSSFDNGEDRPVKALDRSLMGKDEPETEELPKKKLYFGPRP